MFYVYGAVVLIVLQLGGRMEIKMRDIIEKEERNHNMDLLKIISILFVIILHYNK